MTQFLARRRPIVWSVHKHRNEEGGRERLEKLASFSCLIASLFIITTSLQFTSSALFLTSQEAVINNVRCCKSPSRINLQIACFNTICFMGTVWLPPQHPTSASDVIDYQTWVHFSPYVIIIFKVSLFKLFLLRTITENRRYFNKPYH